MTFADGRPGPSSSHALGPAVIPRSSETERQAARIACAHSALTTTDPHGDLDVLLRMLGLEVRP